MSEMSPADWLRAIAVWSPDPELSWGQLAFTQEERIAAISDALAGEFPPEAFCDATVKLVAARCETFPNYGWCCKVLEARP